VPVAEITDSPTICISINVEWVSILLGLVNTLTAQSTWKSDDPAEVDRGCDNGFEFLHLIMNSEACPVPTMFRLDPDDPHFWDFSNDGGSTWERQPDTVIHFTPEFPVDGGAPGGYDLTVNGDLSHAAIPLLTAHQPDAVINDPTGDAINTILPALGIDGFQVRALAAFGAQLRSDAVAAYFAKHPTATPTPDSVIQIAGPESYDYPLLEVP
jgi:hypothetical protein